MDRAAEQEVNVHEGIEKTIIVLAHKLRSGIHIDRDYDVQLPTIRANGAELNQVWANLVDNAIDAMQGRGRISIRTRHEDGAISVEIGDEGQGIPSELASRIVDP
jgi:signal transduction histidine kinase